MSVWGVGSTWPGFVTGWFHLRLFTARKTLLGECMTDCDQRTEMVVRAIAQVTSQRPYVMIASHREALDTCWHMIQVWNTDAQGGGV